MRNIQTFVLRLLIDPDTPGALRGAVQGIADSQAHPFGNEQALLALLRQMARLERKGSQVDQAEEECYDE